MKNLVNKIKGGIIQYKNYFKKFIKLRWSQLYIRGTQFFKYFKKRVEIIHNFEYKKWIKKQVQYITYIYRLGSWLLENLRRRLINFFKQRIDILRQASYLVGALLVATLVNNFSGENITQDILSNYLFAAGAMTGGTIAIVFTISIFLLQNASALYSSQYFEVYIHDWKEKSVYFIVIIITLVILGSGLFVGSLASLSPDMQKLFTTLSLLFIGIVFALIDWQYKNVLGKINPSTAIKFLEKEGGKFLNRLKKDAIKIAKIVQAKDGSVTDEMALAYAYNNTLQPFIANLDRQLENLVEIALKLSDKQEVQTTKRAFTAVHNLLAKFFDIRKNSSMIIPVGSALLAVQSDSQTFLSKNYERLNKAAEKFIREGKDENATYIIDIYDSLAKRAQDIVYISHSNDNPIFELTEGYLGYLIDNGQRAKNMEVVFQGVRVLGDMAIIAAHKGYEAHLLGIQERISKIAIYGLTEKHTIIVDRCTSNYLEIIKAVFGSKKLIRRHGFDDALESIATIANYASALIASGYLPNNFTIKMSLSKGYDEMFLTISTIMNHYAQMDEGRDKQSYRGDIVDFFEEINRTLRRLSENLKNSDSTLIDSIGRLLSNLNVLMVDMIMADEFKDIKEDLISHLSWNIYLPGWFAHHAEKFDGGSNAFHSLNESVAKTGILASEKLNNKKLTISSINALYSLTKQTLEKTTSIYGYDSPRVLEKACYLGILALKKGWRDVFAEIAVHIYEFEPNYVKKYFSNIPKGINLKLLSPRKEQLFNDLLSWRNDFSSQKLNGGLRIRDDAEAMMYSLIEPIDIDRFMYEVWKKLPANSELTEEIELHHARNELLKTLRKIQKNG